jgi:Trypsin-like peptidase domain
MRKILSFILALSLTTFAIGGESTIPEHCYNNTIVIKDDGSHASGVLFTRQNSVDTVKHAYKWIDPFFLEITDEVDLTFTSKTVTFIWTVGHVADYYMRADGTFRDVTIVRGDKTATARVIRAGDCYAADDLALLQVIGDGLKGDARFYRAFNEVKLGMEIIHCGSPYDSILNENLIFHGNISHVDRTMSFFFMPEPRQLDQCDIIAYPGCSGGPIFDTVKGDILGLMSLGGEAGLTAMVPTRIIYEWAKSHDCLWAFDPEVPLPDTIISWRGDVLTRLIESRDTSVIDERWGSADFDCSSPSSSEVEIEDFRSRFGPTDGKFQRPRFLGQ